MTITSVIVKMVEKEIEKEVTEQQQNLIDQIWRYAAVIEILKKDGRSKSELEVLSIMYRRLDEVIKEFEQTLET